MGGLDQWYADQLKSPVGQLVVLILMFLLRMGFGYLNDKRKTRRTSRQRKSQDA